jgi:hypothetical protein
VLSPLNKAAVAHLSALIYQPDAKRSVCWLPLGGICWQDEIPDFNRFLTLGEEERSQIYRLFHIRFKIWDDEALSEDEQGFWNGARSQVPPCPIFHRLELSEDDKNAQRQVEEEFAAFLTDADKVTVSEDANGLQSFSATFDLTQGKQARVEKKSKKKSWWKALFAHSSKRV